MTGTPNHTPGPWKVYRNIGRKGEIGVVASAAPCIICTMGNAKEWPTEAEANASFIASAPYLLEALRSIETRASCAPNDDPDAAERELTRIMLTARAAIRKATGAE